MKRFLCLLAVLILLCVTVPALCEELPALTNETIFMRPADSIKPDRITLFRTLTCPCTNLLLV